MNISLAFPPLLKGVKTIVGLQFTDKVIRLLELGKDKKPLSEPIEVNLEGKDKEKVLREVVQKYGLSGKRVVACIPVNDGLLKFYKYPASMSKKDLQSAIEWSIKRELSAMREETYYDYFILEPGAEGKQVGVVLVLSRKETVEGIRKMVESVGLKLHTLDYEVVAIINYGLYHKLPVPFSILYIDYNYSILTTYSPTNISYYVTYWSFSEFLKSRDEESLESFFAEIRNIVVLNDLSSMYVAGPIIADEEMLTRIMENLPILGILDLEELKPNFFIPYILSIRGMEG
ncbi:type IV pilus biogenesis protein PilM [Pampinifervens florentissimum]|uniref:type IV pilus biogenesis protein PilM n=1 Tax=Pampinifervens florentissimum TaxID=1632019 RepID=UPI0013B480AC|nr:pilus assembly protein PilM [Hydrogenobacter sp. T-8]QID32497.1 pilus assembly protein PilM [Hydrogenobacter sp. T-8]